MPTPTGVIVFDGNSLSRVRSPYPSWPNTMLDALGWTGAPGLKTYNVSTGGITTGQLLSRVSTTVDVLKGNGPTNIVCCWELTNDIYYGAAPIHAFNRMARYCAERKALGWTVITATMTPRFDIAPPPPSDIETSRLAVNTLMRNWWRTFADALVDFSDDPVIGAPGAEYNTTYYEDQVHFVTAGIQRVAALFQPTFSALAL